MKNDIVPAGVQYTKNVFGANSSMKGYKTIKEENNNVYIFRKDKSTRFKLSVICRKHECKRRFGLQCHRLLIEWNQPKVPSVFNSCRYFHWLNSLLFNIIKFQSNIMNKSCAKINRTFLLNLDSNLRNLFESIPLFELNNIAPLWQRVWFNMNWVPGHAKEISTEIREYSGFSSRSRSFNEMNPTRSFLIHQRFRMKFL